MPIYEYEALEPKSGCPKCRIPFEVIQGLDEAPLTRCPDCNRGVRRVISWCRAVVIDQCEHHTRVERQIGEYESQGMWSHAAELADKHSEKNQDTAMKSRALDDYKKAGYDVDSHSGKSES